MRFYIWDWQKPKFGNMLSQAEGMEGFRPGDKSKKGAAKGARVTQAPMCSEEGATNEWHAGRRREAAENGERRGHWSMVCSS